MHYAVTLPLDAAAAAGKQRMWHALAEQASADDALRLGYVPQISFVVLSNEIAVPQVKQAVSRVAGHWTTLPVAIAGFGIFPSQQPVTGLRRS
jgi:hypothetical protein